MVIGMTYKSVSDLGKLDISGGSAERDVVICSVFDNVFINNIKIEDTQFTLLLVREHSKSHEGRLLISYAPYIKYNGMDNRLCIDKMQSKLGCTAEGCWFVYDITIKNQSDLYFQAVVVNPQSPMVYSAITSRNRSEEWKAMIPADDENLSNKQIKETELQQIYYGAPGTGKSNTIKRQTEVAERDGHVFRTTFHPDSDYATFVGCFKPTTKRVPIYSTYGEKAVAVKDAHGDTLTEDRIVYAFVPQAFTNAYTRAWNTTEEVYLVIEEINRGNCAQIFGDLFQLLDRGADGRSEYPIDADSDLASHIAKALAGSPREDFPNGVKDGTKLVLPENLYIWATMNTSDQSLFPIDSAFKRRWDWHYLPIEDAGKGWKIKVNGNEYDWYAFLEAINKEVLALTHSEDKQLGYFFAKAKNGIIDADTLVNKVYFYLWTDVFKDYDIESQRAFRKPGSNEAIAFRDFFTPQGVDEMMADQVLVNLEIERLR